MKINIEVETHGDKTVNITIGLLDAVIWIVLVAVISIIF